MTVSVIIPVFNTADSAVRAALSLVKGTYKDLEIILVDDGSVDDSLKFLKEFKRQYDLRAKNSNRQSPKIKILHQENGGAASARNLGLEKASGKYVCFVDSDDKVEKTFVSHLVQAIEKYDNYNSDDLKIALASAGIKYYRVKNDSSADLYTKEVKPQLPDEDYESFVLRLIRTDGRLYSSANKIFRRNIIEHFNIRFNEKMNFAEDTKFVLDYLKAAHRVRYDKIEFVLEPLYIYYYGTETSTVSMSSLSWSNWEKSYKNLVDWAGKRPTKKQQKLLAEIRVRWRFSHALAVARSRQSFGHKCQHASPFLVIPAMVVVKFRR